MNHQQTPIPNNMEYDFRESINDSRIIESGGAPTCHCDKHNIIISFSQKEMIMGWWFLRWWLIQDWLMIPRWHPFYRNRQWWRLGSHYQLADGALCMLSVMEQKERPRKDESWDTRVIGTKIYTTRRPSRLLSLYSRRLDGMTIMEEQAVPPLASKKEEPAKMVSLREIFSFARTRTSRLCIAGSFFFACISGASFPGKGDDV